ncbi:MAG: PEP-CTERM sorting domain-containing protein [Verrucomicrobiales bacterium]
MKKTFLSILAASVALVGVGRGATIDFSNMTGALSDVSFAEVQVNGVAIANGTGFAAIGTTALGVADLIAATTAAGLSNGILPSGAAALAATFQSLESIQFGDGAAGGFAGYFSGASTVAISSGAGTNASFIGAPIILVIGNGADIASSTHLGIFAEVDGGGNFTQVFKDDDLNPVNADQLNVSAGNLALGQVSGAGAFSTNAIQLAEVGIPEPGAAILALLSAGILFMRRRRR